MLNGSDYPGLTRCGLSDADDFGCKETIISLIRTANAANTSWATGSEAGE